MLINGLNLDGIILCTSTAVSNDALSCFVSSPVRVRGAPEMLLLEKQVLQNLDKLSLGAIAEWINKFD